MTDFKKVIVIGLDGLEHSIVSELLSRGELPHLAGLRESGGFGKVRTTYPAQTPVAWSTFATGTNPGGHGIFDFVSRNPSNYLPDLALNRFEQASRFLPPKIVNLRRGTPVWDFVSRAGKNATILRCPCTYPPDKVKGSMLAGMGVPDLRGGLGTSTFYSTDSGVESKESENVVKLEGSSTEFRTYIPGPLNARTGGDFRFEVDVRFEPVRGRAIIRSKGKPDALEVRLGAWSDWLHVKFKQGALQSVKGAVRFYLVRLEPYYELYASPVNYDPGAMHLYPISSPPEYARDLAKQIGSFYTTGMVEDHGGLNNGRIDEAAFLEQCELVLKERERMMLLELSRFRDGLFFCLFDTPDRVQHMFWRFREPGHPANNGGDSSDFKHVIDEHYRRCDEIVGKALAYADDKTLFIALSDHGFNSFQRGVHLNTWLNDHGFLKLKNGMKPGDEHGDFFPHVDWDETKAYALGLTGIYLNLREREAKGSVKQADAQQVRSDIIKGLTGFKDEERDEVAIRSVMTRAEVYSGAFAEGSPDLVVNFNAGYRVSWQAALGGVPAGHCCNNNRKWSGDHCIDPGLVPGVLFMNRPFAREHASLVDLAPTVLAGLGIAKGSKMEGDSLLGQVTGTTQITVPERDERPKKPGSSPAPQGVDNEEQIKDRLKGLGYI